MASYAANNTNTPVARVRGESPLATGILLAAFMCIPVLLSIFFFSGQSLRLDESQSLWQSSRSVGYIFTIVAEDVHVPLYHLLLHFWRIIFGNTVASARAMSLLFYVASIPALYALGKVSYNRRVGLFAAFLFSISPFMNWYGNEIRMYTLFTFFIILNQYFFIKIMRSKGQPNENSDHLWALYTITALLGVFSHYFFFLSLASQAVFYFLRHDLFPKGSFRRFVTAMIVVLVVFLPWGWYVLHLGEAANQQPLLAVPTTVDLFSTLSQFLFGFQNDNINTVLLSLWPATILFAFLGLRKRRDNRTAPETEYLLLTLVVSIAIAFIGSFIIAPVFVSRYLIFTIPSLYLLLAGLFEGYTPSFARTMRYGIALLMVVMMAVEIISPTTPVKENYEAATDYLNAHVTGQDVVILSAPFTVYPVEYYYRGAAPITTLPIWDQYSYGAIPAFSAATLPAQVASTTSNAQNVYLLLSYDQGYETNIKTYFQDHYQMLYTQTYSDDLTLYVYRMRYDTDQSAITTTLK